MRLVAYADESHSGRDSEVLIVAGWIALVEEWNQFCVGWKKVLDHHASPYFHFREWADASAVVRSKRRASSEFLKKNPYREWNQSKLDTFLFELAEVAAASGASIIGGYVPANKLAQDKANMVTTTLSSAEELCIEHFFGSAISTITRERSPLKRQPITFIFDYSQDSKWRRMVRMLLIPGASRIGGTRTYRSLQSKTICPSRLPTWCRIVFAREWRTC